MLPVVIDVCVVFIELHPLQRTPHLVRAQDFGPCEEAQAGVHLHTPLSLTRRSPALPHTHTQTSAPHAGPGRGYLLLPQLDALL
jgi:hypothetical protein